MVLEMIRAMRKPTTRTQPATRNEVSRIFLLSSLISFFSTTFTICQPVVELVTEENRYSCLLYTSRCV